MNEQDPKTPTCGCRLANALMHEALYDIANLTFFSRYGTAQEVAKSALRDLERGFREEAANLTICNRLYEID